MQRHIATALLTCLVIIGGCAQPQGPMGPPTRPEVPSQMAQLEPFMGNWSGTAEMVSPSAEEMKAMMPEGEGAGDAPMTFEGANNNSWALNGMFMVGEGWHAMGPDEKMHYTEYWAWDAKAGKFHTWFFTDWGEIGEGWATVSPDGKTFNVTATGSDSDGNPTKGSGSLTFTSDGTMEWSWAETNKGGRMEFKGVSTKK